MSLARARSTPLSNHAGWFSGEPVRNAWLTIPDPYLAEIVASNDMVDAVTLDLQHGLFDRARVVEVLRAIAGRGKVALARLPDGNEALIGFLLDVGASGLILAGVDRPEEAETFVAASRYPPAGRRSHGPSRAALPGAPDAPALFAMIETRMGLRCAGSIAAVDGLDGLFVGPGDLGIALGLGPGQDRSEPAFVTALEEIQAAARQSGKLLAIHAATATYAARMAEQGFTLVTVWVDVVEVKASLAKAENNFSQEHLRTSA